MAWNNLFLLPSTTHQLDWFHVKYPDRPHSQGTKCTNSSSFNQTETTRELNTMPVDSLIWIHRLYHANPRQTQRTKVQICTWYGAFIASSRILFSEGGNYVMAAWVPMEKDNIGLFTNSRLLNTYCVMVKSCNWYYYLYIFLRKILIEERWAYTQKTVWDSGGVTK